MTLATSRLRLPITMVLAASLIVAAPLLSGCGLIRGAVNNATGGVLPSTTVPADFPSDVPLYDGEIKLALAVPGENGDKAWNVTVVVPGVSTFDEISTQLTDAGFASTDLTGSSAEGAQGSFTKDKLLVFVLITHGEKDSWVANYTVTNTNSEPSPSPTS